MVMHLAPPYHRHPGSKQVFGPKGHVADAVDEQAAELIVLSLNIAKKAADRVAKRRRIYGDGEDLPALAEAMPRAEYIGTACRLCGGWKGAPRTGLANPCCCDQFSTPPTP